MQSDAPTLAQIWLCTLQLTRTCDLYVAIKFYALSTFHTICMDEQDIQKILLKILFHRVPFKRWYQKERVEAYHRYLTNTWPLKLKTRTKLSANKRAWSSSAGRFGSSPKRRRRCPKLKRSSQRLNIQRFVSASRKNRYAIRRRPIGPVLAQPTCFRIYSID